jgi:hypothetical protein
MSRLTPTACRKSTVAWPGRILLAFALSVVPRPADAQPHDAAFVLTYESPPGCPGEAALTADVQEHLHDRSHIGGVQLNLKIERRESGFIGILVAYDESRNRSARQIEGKTCSDVAHALAFLAGLALELGGRIEPKPPPAQLAVAPPPGDVTPAPTSASRQAEPAQPAHFPAPTPATRSIAASVVLLGGAVGGFAPGALPSGELGVEVAGRPRLFSPAARLSGFSGSGSLEGPGGTATLWFLAGRLELCFLRLGNAVVAVRSCAGAEVGNVHAQGEIGSDPRSVNELWASVELTLRAQWFLNRSLFVELGAGFELPLERTRYYFQPDRTLYTVPWLTGRGALGVGMQF